MMQRTRASAKSGAVASTAKERHRLLLGLALLLTVFAEVTPMGHFGSVSTTITSNNDPSALQQLATFAALAEVAEEEDLDWGALTRLDRSAAKTGPKKPLRLEPTSTVSTDDTSPTPTSPSSSDGEDGPDRSGHTDTSATGSMSTSSSHRRPHRRQHRRKGGVSAGSLTASSAPSDGGYGPSSVTSLDSLGISSPMAEQGSVHNYKIWSQFHVMEVAYSTRSNNFIHVTERFAEYQRMYPIVYQCAINHVACPNEAELLATPSTGVAASRYWSCSHCGRRHDVVRENCQRCRAPSHFAKLFVGQAIKEVSCAPSLIRLLYATHPDIPLHRIECHTDQANRGKGCAALYVAREHAQELIDKLDRNVFFDVDDGSGELFAHYVYTQQRDWLTALAAERVSTKGGGKASELGPATAAALPRERPPYLPWNPLVVEESKPAQGHRPPRGQLHAEAEPLRQPPATMAFAL